MTHPTCFLILENGVSISKLQINCKKKNVFVKSADCDHKSPKLNVLSKVKLYQRNRMGIPWCMASCCYPDDFRKFCRYRC